MTEDIKAHETIAVPRYGTTKDVAALLQISTRAVERLTATGKLAGAIKIGGARRYDMNMLTKSLASDRKGKGWR